MGATPILPHKTALQITPRWLAGALGPDRHIAVACSGGRDSVALLHATWLAAQQLGQTTPITVHALHVHHGLQRQADAWGEQVLALCQSWHNSLGKEPRSVCLPAAHLVGHVQRLSGAPTPGDSLEAWARRGRYTALADMARAAHCQTILLAHHRQDQTETVLLQLLRSAGPAGLAAMPAQALRGGLHWLRPWLAEPPENIAAYVAAHHLPVILDPSNDDTRYARNRLRHRVLPALYGAFPHADTALSHAARRAAEAAQGLRELAELDAARVLSNEPLNGPPVLDIGAWCQLSTARRGLLLRHWLGQLAPAPPETLIQRLLTELPRATTGQRWPLGRGWLHAQRRRLHFHESPP